MKFNFALSHLDQFFLGVIALKRADDAVIPAPSPSKEELISKMYHAGR